MKRREVIKGLALLPLSGAVIGSVLPNSVIAAPHEFNPALLSSSGTASADDPLRPGPEIFQSIGVEPLINCMGTYTIIGGSLERPAVRAAMEAASHSFVQYDELAEGIGRRLAELTGAEWGMVSAGCASCLKQATIACVAGGNPEKLIRIPDLTGFGKIDVVIPIHSRNEYDHAIRNVGVNIINVATPEELENALNHRTAMIYLLADDPSAAGEPLSLESIVRIAKPKNIPVLVDAAAEDLTVPNVHLERGATMVAYSGGKALCGPQCSGLLLGRKDLIQSAWYGSAPHHGPGRDNKVGREEMIGALAAIEAWVTMDHKAQWMTWLSYLDNISRRISKIEGVKIEVQEPTDLSNHSPVLNISWDPEKLHLTGQEMAEEVGRNKPRIALAFGNGREPRTTQISITSGQMQPGNDKAVADRLYGVLSQKRSPKPSSMKDPSANISGAWDVNIEFYSSSSPYTWFIEQDGNWIKGSHDGEFSKRNIVGTIEGDQVRLRSAEALPGDHVAFTYLGTISGNTISGSIYMVEYGNAKFTASRNNKPVERKPIIVPGGPPLAT
jgi:L-seryl-tRNA(Ser) seleniumtransferase